MTITQALLLPAFLYVALVIVQGLRLFAARAAVVRSGAVTYADIKAGRARWPDPARYISENYNNQFEFPVLFHACVPLLLVTGLADGVAVALAWLFLAARLGHAIVHTTTNYVPYRGLLFGVSVTAVILMWLWFALRLFIIG